MQRSPSHCFSSLDDLSERDVQSLLASARMFKQAGAGGQPLRGRYAAVLCESHDSASAEVFAAAATALGATVVRIRPSAARLADPRSALDTAPMLGRLYCAVACDGLEPSVAANLARCAGVPVFDAVAGDTHPTRLLGDLLTMCEHARKPMAEITLCIAGDAGSPLATAWRRLAELTSIGVCTCEPGSDAAVHHSDFVCEPPPSDRSGAPPALRAVDADPGQAGSLRAEQGENHRRVVQALLSNTVG